MTQTCTRLALAVILAAGSLAAAPAPARPQPCYVIDARGQKQEGVSLRVTSADGDLELSVDGRVRLPFKAGSYRAAFIPKPEEVAALEKAYEQGRHAEVTRQAGALFGKYRFVGWGGRIAWLEGMSLLQTGQPENALRAFARGQQAPGEAAPDLTRGMVSALLELKDTARAEPLLAALIASPRNADAAFAFLCRGRILADAGKPKEAVLEYLKVLLFFEDSPAVGDLRAEARRRAVALLKANNDGRWKQIEAIP